MFARLLWILDRFREDDDGASLVEYALLVALIALVTIAGITAAGTSISTIFSKIADTLSGIAS